MIIYRITFRKYANDLSGVGAALYGGRWNKKGTPVLYSGVSEEIALLETVVHTPPMLVPKLDILTLEIPDNSIKQIKIKELPKNWIDYPAPSILAEIGDNWVKKGKTLALKVPSCIIHSAHIYILNCRHKDFNKVRVKSHRKFYFDSRLTR